MAANQASDHSQQLVRPLKERQREQREAMILAAAHAVFLAKGYHEASIDEIAGQVGISKGVIYQHFASKEDLVEALIAQQISDFLAMLDRVLQAPSSVCARLEQILAYAYAGLNSQHSGVLLELHHRIGLPNAVIEKRPQLQAQVVQATNRLSSLFDEGKASGELNAQIPTPIMVATFIGLLSLRGYEQLIASNQFSPADLIPHISQIFFRGTVTTSS
ncbi:TetR/AcrR family transcriptional regulator [Herpetosiphon sp. NSE202]|uniref:TetR/AcrR family transcriptional regulator n=1 Tax=Herpetosiphon sp. NSE202 TaxID=3351349 RepID=UPI0036268066